MLDARKFEWSAWLTFHDEHVRRGPGYYLTQGDYFDWTFRDNPYNPTPGEYQFALWHEGDEIVGYIGRIWSPMLVGGAERRCLWQETSFVRPDRRGQGIGTELYAWVAGEDVTGNIQGVMQPQVDRVLEKTLGEYGHRERMQRAVLRADHFAEATYYWPLTRMTMADGGPVLQHDFATWAAHLWERSAPRYGMTTHRTKAWLRWRFLDHPRAVQYRLIATDAAVAIVRIERAHLHTLVRIVDLWGVTTQDVQEVVKAVIQYATGVAATAVDFLCTGWPDGDAFDALGFERWSGAEMTQLPMLFNPLDTSMREEQVTLYGKGVTQDQLMYITRADDGRDRP